MRSFRVWVKELFQRCDRGGGTGKTGETGEARSFEQGMSLAPGESAVLQFDLAQVVEDPDLREEVARGEKTVELRNLSQTEYAPGKYRRDCLIVIDGKVRAVVRLTFEGPERELR